jgi:hypothetical protein
LIFFLFFLFLFFFIFFFLQKSGLAPTHPCDPLQSENRVYSASKVKARYGQNRG